MKKFTIGKNVKQINKNYSAFIPDKFPSSSKIEVSQKIKDKHDRALFLLGQLNGVANFVPDRDLFLAMFVRKDAASSSAIEGTNATFEDSIIYQNQENNSNIPKDVDDIIHYIDALNYGIVRSNEMPLTLRFICELHENLMLGARSTQHAYPGEFRRTQNWIGGTTPENARFVPPPVNEMKRALGDLEKFIHVDDEFPPLIKAGLLHAQFETIHPFTDGNGRTGRMLITMFLIYKKMLDLPIFYLSAYFRKYQDVYYDKINGYHNGRVEEWVEFFLDGMIEVLESSINTCKKIVDLRFDDMKKVQQLGEKASKSTTKILDGLYKLPIVGISDVVEMSGLTRASAYSAIERLVEMDILRPLPNENNYGKKWSYYKYLSMFE